jgi:trigger factor
MQVSVESTGKLERRMQVQVPAERVSKEIASRLKQISRTARLNGFRPGKAPLTVIRQQFGPQVHREVIGELMQSSFSEAVTQNQLAPAGSPRIEPQSIGEGQDLTYVATFEVFPEVVLQPIDSLEIERVTAEVTESDVDAMIERLRKQQMKYTQVARAAMAGDKATVDFEGAIDGVPFAGGKGEKVAIVLGENRMLPQLEAGLIGAAPGEQRVVDVDFPPDYRATELAGKRAKFTVDVKTVEEPRLPEVDAEFCEAFGVTEGGVEKLREDVVANMRRELDQTLRTRNKAAVM